MNKRLSVCFKTGNTKSTVRLRLLPDAACSRNHTRPTLLSAAIVRIMKARKTLTHTLLISELFRQVCEWARACLCSHTRACAMNPISEPCMTCLWI